MTREMKDSGIEWIGEIPAEWEILPQKYVMHKEKVLCDHYSGEDIISLSMQGVHVRDLDAGGKMPTTFDGYQYVEPEDMLLCLFDIDVTPRCVGVVHEYGLTSPAYSRFKMHTGFLNRYYDYLLRFIDNEKVFVHLAKNLRSSLTETDFGSIKTIAPSSEEQARIAAFLDRKCSEIDSVIADTQRTIEEYKKLKQSIITEAVTKGVRGKRPMKDSGIEWIGEIPAEWETKKIKFSTDFIQRKYTSEDGAINYIGLENIVSWNGQYVETASEYDREQSLICEEGDILFGKLRPYLAKVYISTQKQCCSGEFAVIRAHNDVITRFLWYQLISHGFIFMVDRSTYGTKMPRANVDFIKNVGVAIPPINEQREIIDYLDAKCCEMDKLISSKQQLLTELESYKKSVIYEYVTGKKEVPACQ